MEYFILTYNGKEIGFSGDDIETGNNQYDLSKACQVCGTGGVLKDNLKCLSFKKNNKNIFSTLNGDYIISEKLYKILINKKIKVKNLKSITDTRKKKLPFFHLKSDLILPKATRINGVVIENQCQNCLRDGFYNNINIGNCNGTQSKVYTLELHYNNISLNDLLKSDIFSTWESFGSSNLNKTENKIINFARPLVIISENFKNILIENSIKNLEFEKIFLNYKK